MDYANKGILYVLPMLPVLPLAGCQTSPDYPIIDTRTGNAALRYIQRTPLLKTN